MQLIMRHRLLSALLLAAAGCGGGLGGGSPDPNSYDAFRAQFAAAVCAQSVSCGVAPSIASCQSSRPEDVLMVTTRAGVRAGTIRYDAEKASSCLGYMNRAYAGEPCSVTAFATVDKTGMDDCDSVLTGTISDGGSCLLSLECVSGYCRQADPLCYVGDQCCPGTCAPAAAPTPLGGTCSVATPANCVKGTVCVATTATTTQGTCQVPSTVVGTPCGSTAECALPLYCAMEVSINPTTGTCQPPIASGAPCGGDVYIPCDDWRDYCHPTTAVCTQALPVGAACDDVANICIGYAQCLNGKCVAMAGLHAHCDSIGGVICLGNLQCSPLTSTCEPAATPISCI